MAFFARLLAALRSFVASIGHALGDGAHLTGGAARSLGRDIAAVVPGEWKQRITLLFATGLALVPVIYSGNMTWSFNDPSGHLDHVTAAVVDADRGADSTSADGTSRHLDVGGTFTENLLGLDKSTVYRFVRTDQATADAGLANGRYGAVVEIPADFSADIASLGGKDPQKAAPALLTVRTDDTINYVSGNFTKSVGTALSEALRANVLQQYLDSVYVGFTSMHDQLSTAADGAHRLADGSKQLHDGTSRLATASGQLSDGANQLSAGSYDLVVGLGQISGGAATLASGAHQTDQGASTLASGLGTLSSQSGRLTSGADQLASATGQVADGSASLASGAGQLASGTQTLDDRVTAAQQRAQGLGIDQGSVDRTAADLQTTVDDLARGASDVNAALSDPSSQASQLKTSASDLSNRLSTAADDANTLSQALAARSGDATTVSSSAQTIAQDVDTLASGVQQAAKDAPQHSQDARGLDSSVTDYTDTVDRLAAQCRQDGGATASSQSNASDASDAGGRSTTRSAAPSQLCDQLEALAASSQGLRTSADTVSQGAANQEQALTNVGGTAASVRTTADGMKDASSRVSSFLQSDGSDAASLQTLTRDVTALRTDASELAKDSSTLNDGVAAAQRTARDATSDPATVQRRIDDLHAQATSAVQALPTVYEQADEAAQGIHRLNAGAQQVSSGADRLSSATGQVADGASTLDQGVGQYTGGVDQAAGGAQQLQQGTSQVASGADQLSSAAGQAQGGAQQLHDGAQQLADGSQQLHDGQVQADAAAGQVADGSQQLSDGLGSAVDKVPSYTDAQREHLAKTASNPVHYDFARDHGLDRFGEGLVPLFLSIGLWVGGMSIFLMMSPFSARAAREGAGALALLFGGLLPAQLLGVVQTLIAYLVLRYGVHITAVHPVQFVLMACLTSIVFVALNHGFGAMFGPIGKFVALVLIALQVSGAGGTYPVQTLPAFFRAIHPFLPMSHAIDAFRGAIGGGWVDPAGDIAALLAWLALALLLGLGGARKAKRRGQAEREGAVELPATA